MQRRCRSCTHGFLVMFTDVVSVSFHKETAPRHSRIALFLQLCAACCPLALSRRSAASCWPVIRGPRCLLWLGVTLQLLLVNLYAGLLSICLVMPAHEQADTRPMLQTGVSRARVLRDRQAFVFSSLQRGASMAIGRDCRPSRRWCCQRRLKQHARTKLGAKLGALESVAASFYW